MMPRSFQTNNAMPMRIRDDQCIVISDGEDDVKTIVNDSGDDVKVLGYRPYIQRDTMERLERGSQLDFDEYILPHRSYAYYLKGRTPRNIVIHARDVLSREVMAPGARNRPYKCLITLYKFFRNMGHHTVKIFVSPRLQKLPARWEIIPDLNILVSVNAIHIIPECYCRTEALEERYIIDYATNTGGVVLSNEAFLALSSSNAKYQNVVKNQVLPYVYVDGILMVPCDPLGKYGPPLIDVLSRPSRHRQFS